MAIAVKDGRVITKNGRIAESCDCCKELCCDGGIGEFPGGAATLYVTRKLNVIANSACSCEPFSPPPSSATLCFDEYGTFTQTEGGACTRALSGVGISQAHYLPGPVEQGPYSVTVGFLQSPCRVYAALPWPFFRCAPGLLSNFFAWDYVASQATYSATYYVFLFVDFAGTNYSIVNTTGIVPADEPSPFVWGGTTWTVTMELSFA